MDVEPKITPVYVPVPPVPTKPDAYTAHTQPLIIDNGSTNFRYGFATSELPHSSPNIVSKYKERKYQKQILVFGDAVDLESGARAQARTPWEGDVLLNFDAMESALDFAFIRLGIDTPSIDHPVLMTERICSPLYSRGQMSEMLFEQYSVPSLTYALDSLMSFYHNNGNDSSSDGLVVSFNTASTSIVPVLNGKGILSKAKRLPWGSSQASEFLLKLIQLKYPNFPTRVTSTQASWMYQTFCEVSPDYTATLRELRDPLQMRAQERIIQFPFTASTEVEKTEEEIARLAERRREQGKKLQELQAQKRLEKLLKMESDFQELTALKETRGNMKKAEWLARLEDRGFENEQELDDTIKGIELDLKKARKKSLGDDEAMEEPSFPLVDTPDAELDEEGLKEKKKQKLMKAGYEARLRARKEKEREREAKELDDKREQEERERDPKAWAERLRKEHEMTMNKIRERKRRKEALNDRKSAASQARMKNIASLASDQPATKKRRKGANDDTFGADDEDWAIYRKINTAAPSSEEEDDLIQLSALENRLLTHDPTFTYSHTYAGLSEQKSALMSAFRPMYEEGDVEGRSRIHLNVERWRAPETLFIPGMAGVDCAGLGEILGNIVNGFEESERARLVKNVFLTGGPSLLPGTAKRVYASLRPLLPPEMELNVNMAKDPQLDAWKGMAAFARTGEFPKVGVTRADYEEHGSERIKRWWGGNWNNSYL